MAEAKGFCGHCAAEATDMCGGEKGCKGIRYCSTECQRADWLVRKALSCLLHDLSSSELTKLRKWHKLLCEDFANFKNKPNANDRRAIFLPQNDTKPRFVWIQVEPIEPDSESDDGMLLADEYDEDLGVPLYDREGGNAMSNFEGLFNATHNDTMLVVGKMGSGEHLDHSIHLRHLETFFDLPRNI